MSKITSNRHNQCGLKNNSPSQNAPERSSLTLVSILLELIHLFNQFNKFLINTLSPFSREEAEDGRWYLSHFLTGTVY